MARALAFEGGRGYPVLDNGIFRGAMIFLRGEIKIDAGIALEELGARLSKDLFAGLGFRADPRLDEVPALSLRVFGLEFLLFQDDSGRTLLLANTVAEAPYSAADAVVLDISEYMRDRVRASGLKAEVSKPK